VRALVAAQNALRQDVSLATEVGHMRFPPHEAGLIAGIVHRDLPFYDASIGEASVAAINAFARDMGVLAGDVPYHRIVAAQFRHLWQTGSRQDAVTTGGTCAVTGGRRRT
jgi:NitT/TauT family transport system substrate-binding protein